MKKREWERETPIGKKSKIAIKSLKKVNLRPTSSCFHLHKHKRANEHDFFSTKNFFFFLKRYKFKERGGKIRLILSDCTDDEKTETKNAKGRKIKKK